MNLKKKHTVQPAWTTIPRMTWHVKFISYHQSSKLTSVIIQDHLGNRYKTIGCQRIYFQLYSTEGHSTFSLLQSLKISVAINEKSLSQIALASCNHTKIINGNNNTQKKEKYLISALHFTLHTVTSQFKRLPLSTSKENTFICSSVHLTQEENQPLWTLQLNKTIFSV